MPDGSKLSRKDLDDLTEFVAIYGAKGLAWIRIGEDGWQSPIVKFLSDDERERLTAAAQLVPGNVIMLVADKPRVVHDALANLRLRLGAKLGMIDADAEEPGVGHRLPALRLRRGATPARRGASSVHGAGRRGSRAASKAIRSPSAPKRTTSS